MVERTARIVDDLFYVIGIELMHAAQAVDLRRRATPALALGRETGRLLGAYRRDVSFVGYDRVMTEDIRRSYDFIRRAASAGLSR